MKETFEREDRYIVFKVSDLTSGQIMILTAWNATVKAQRLEKGKDALTVVVVESDWPEYEIVWNMIQDRTNTGLPPNLEGKCHLVKMSKDIIKRAHEENAIKRPITEGHIKGEIKGGKSDISSRPSPPPPIRR